MTSSAAELRESDLASLKEQLVAAQKRHLLLRIRKAVDSQADTSEFKKLRREIARVNTELRRRELQS